MLLHLPAEEVEVVPPEFALPHDHVRALLLRDGHFLVVAEVQQARMVEHLHYVAYQVGADLVVLLRRHHPVVLAKPCVVRSGEVHLRNRLQPHGAQPLQLGLQLLDAPRPLDRQLRVARVDDALRNPYDHHVVALGGHCLSDFPPDVFVEAELVRKRMLVVPLGLGLLRGIQRLGMRVRAELQHHRADFRLLRRSAETRRRHRRNGKKHLSYMHFTPFTPFSNP